MESFESDEHVIVRLDRGDMVLESIEQACEDHEVDTGAVTAGIGTLSTLNIHYVDRTDLPDDQADRNVDLELEGGLGGHRHQQRHRGRRTAPSRDRVRR